MTIFCLYIFDRYVRSSSNTQLIPQNPNQSPAPGIATVSTITTGTAQSDQSAQTKAATSSQPSRTLSRPSLPPLQQQQQALRPRAQHPARPFPVRAIPSPPTRASSSRSATVDSPLAFFPGPPLPHHHYRRRRRRLCRLKEAPAVVQACLLMRSPSWCTASSSR
jgi:hypothetical protein